MAEKEIYPIRRGKPKWLKRPLPTGSEFEKIRQLVHRDGLHTVCREAHCPNQFQCYGEGTATFLILGDKCSRNCRFCAVGHGPTGRVDFEEPGRVAKAVEELALRYTVVTSVTRDDLADGGAAVFAQTIAEIRRLPENILIEVLVPDFSGNWDALDTVIAAKPDVLNHNIETVAPFIPGFALEPSMNVHYSCLHK